MKLCKKTESIVSAMKQKTHQENKNKIKTLYLYLKSNKNVAFVNPSKETLKSVKRFENITCYVLEIMTNDDLHEICMKNDLIVFFGEIWSPNHEKLIWLTDVSKRKKLFFDGGLSNRYSSDTKSLLEACFKNLYT